LELQSTNTSEKTEVIHGSKNVMNTILQFLAKANTLSSCDEYKAPFLVFETKQDRKLLDDIKKRGLKVRYITDITKDKIKYCKYLMSFAFEIRHLSGIKANFSVSDTECLVSATLLGEQVQGQSQEQQASIPIQQVIYSNVKDIVQRQNHVFESFWIKAIPAERRIDEIEEGFALGRTEIIQIPSRTKELFIDLVRSAKEEVLLLFPTTNSFLREERIGVIQLLKEAATGTPTKHKVKVRILTPINNAVEKIAQDIMVNQSNNFLDIQPMHIETTLSETNVNTVTIVVIDRKASLVIEKVDDTKEDFVAAIGSATYSTSKPTVLSYISIFENLSNQVKLYKQLKAQDKLQREFINIAAHELRTPAQAIIGYSELALADYTLRQHDKNGLIDATYRNAYRLQKLIKDILDVTRIESNTLAIHKEKVDLVDLISSVVKDMQNKISNNKGCKILILQRGELPQVTKQDTDKCDDDDICLYCDKGKIGQVISNLLNNAIKFTNNEDMITVTISRYTKNNTNDDDDDKNNNNNADDKYIAESRNTNNCDEAENVSNNGSQAKVQGDAIVSIRDTGYGISPEIFPRLFTKFATNSESGTGLGLFISKSIIEAHGGKIWAENNEDGRGATFTFSIPIALK
jgi:two-component system, OmpR family, sensor histidine kinase VicK